MKEPPKKRKAPLIDPATWKCPQIGCKKPLTDHIVTLAQYNQQQQESSTP